MLPIYLYYYLLSYPPREDLDTRLPYTRNFNESLLREVPLLTPSLRSWYQNGWVQTTSALPFSLTYVLKTCPRPSSILK
uniref:Uncharacterized protein n=2 Tax=Picea TaxID=3328 RepID=A0A101LTN2_PICGL|nr:hypothetical protein ABT39_MTgene3614 [Picea glauca]KUM45152.1 hypothetical protein ABT39_MTgene3625 [Picea glauca]KUM51063.1 hypothetical protein ABT39_MTgene909 [Picea glauca]QHR92621.1 hypothetical protein Q903MT_gene6668 [Picea sitchensis]